MFLQAWADHVPNISCKGQNQKSIALFLAAYTPHVYIVIYNFGRYNGLTSTLFLKT